jgi:hypothetical protein
MAEKRKGSDTRKRRRPAAGVTDLAVPARVGRGPVRVTMGSHVLLVESTGSGGSLRLVGPDGAQPLEITVGPEGPVLRLRAGLTVAVDGQLALRADAISLQAQTRPRSRCCSRRFDPNRMARAPSISQRTFVPCDHDGAAGACSVVHLGLDREFDVFEGGRG